MPLNIVGVPALPSVLPETPPAPPAPIMSVDVSPAVTEIFEE